MTRLLIKEDLEGARAVVVKDDELHYLTRVRRHKAGDEVEVQDLNGRRVIGTVKSIGADEALLDLGEELIPVKDCLPVNLLVTVPKHSLMDDVIRKASELGVMSVTPVIAKHSVVKPGEGKLARWRTIAWESRRQCGRKNELVVEDVKPLFDALSIFKNSATKILMDTQSSDGPSVWARKTLAPPICAVIGPEGGFSQKEIEAATGLGFEQATLGHTILRVETAAIATAVLCIAMLGGYD